MKFICIGIVVAFALIALVSCNNEELKNEKEKMKDDSIPFTNNQNDIQEVVQQEINQAQEKVGDLVDDCLTEDPRTKEALEKRQKEQNIEQQQKKSEQSKTNVKGDAEKHVVVDNLHETTKTMIFEQNEKIVKEEKEKIGTETNPFAPYLKKKIPAPDPKLSENAKAQIEANEKLIVKIGDDKQYGKKIGRGSRGEYPLKEFYEAKQNSWTILESRGLDQGLNDQIVKQLFKIDHVIDQYEKEVLSRPKKKQS